MDQIQPQSTISPPPSVSPVIPAPVPKASLFPVLFVVLILILLTATGIFAYQNMQLQKQIAILQSQPTSTPSVANPPLAETPSADPTANWKTYVDSKYGFSFNLPGYYQTENKFWTTDESVNYLSISPQPGNYEGCCFKKSDPVSIRSKAILMESYQNIGTNDWKSKSRFATSHKFIKENVFNENGLSFTKFTALGLGQTGFVDDDRLTGFFIQKGTTLIVISVNHFSENQNEAESFIDKILSTFKFVDQTSRVDTSNWKTYSFPIVGLAFKAPANLSVELTETKNSNTGASVGYSLYIQNNSTDIKKFYQLYGAYQNPPNTNYSEKDLEVYKQDLIPDSITSVTIDGHIGIRGQISGQRNRYVTHLLINNGLLSLFTAEPTVDNEKLSNQIIDTFKFTK